MKTQNTDPQEIEELEAKVEFYEQVFAKLPARIFENSVDQLQNHGSNDYKFPKFQYKTKGTTEAAAKFLQERIHPNDRDSARYGLITHFQKENIKQAVSVLYRVKDFDFGFRWIYNKISLLTAQDSANRRVIGLSIDLSDQLEKDETLIEAMRENQYLYYRLQFKQLSKREREILVYLSKGYTTRSIAEKLHRSPKTIEKHRTNLLRKLNCRNVADLIRLANLAGWLK